VSLLGGEPFAQAEALAPFAAACRSGGMSVMAYSGYTIGEIRAMPGDAAARLLSLCDLLVDGRYDAGRPETRRRWVGSSNQVMHFLTGRYREDDPAFAGANTLEIRVGDGGGVTINGWPAFGAATGREMTGAR
jgi:anaerobic ribonucleoside-triphosphate reductase activating protein